MAILEPRDYQLEGIKWLKETKRGLLTDHPGLGKTLQAAEAAELPLIVSSPAYLSGQWADFLVEQYPTLKIAYANGTRKQRDAILDKKSDIYVVNHEMLATYALPTDFKTVIYDESHHLRNRGTEKSRAAAKLVKNKDKRVYLLSASPMWKGPEDIWMQLHIMYPEIFKSYKDFVDMFFITVNTPYETKILGVKKAMRKLLDEMLSPIKFGRTYKQAGRFLPEIIETVISLDLDAKFKKIYQEVKDTLALTVNRDGEEGWNKLIFGGAGAMHTLRQITMISGKVDATVQAVEDANKMTVVGCWYRDHAEMIHKKLPGSVLLTGDLPSRERQQLAMRAQNRGQHIVATEASICEGVNLSKYTSIVMPEEHWPPGANYQFISRVARDRNDGGLNKEPVNVRYVVVRKTIDSAIHSIAKRRQGSIKDIWEETLV